MWYSNYKNTKLNLRMYPDKQFRKKLNLQTSFAESNKNTKYVLAI